MNSNSTAFAPQWNVDGSFCVIHISRRNQVPGATSRRLSVMMLGMTVLVLAGGGIGAAALNHTAAVSNRLADHISPPGAIPLSGGYLDEDLQPTAALDSAERALSALESVGDSVDHAAALIHISSLLIPLDRERDGLAR